jgi:hypothetical protein
MVSTGGGILFAWTEVNDPPKVVTALVTLR